MTPGNGSSTSSLTVAWLSAYLFIIMDGHNLWTKPIASSLDLRGKKKVEINALSSLPGCAAMGKFVLASGS